MKLSLSFKIFRINNLPKSIIYPALLIKILLKSKLIHRILNSKHRHHLYLQLPRPAVPSHPCFQIPCKRLTRSSPLWKYRQMPSCCQDKIKHKVQPIPKLKQFFLIHTKPNIPTRILNLRKCRTQRTRKKHSESAQEIRLRLCDQLH